MRKWRRSGAKLGKMIVLVQHSETNAFRRSTCIPAKKQKIQRIFLEFLGKDGEFFF
jgi:hypothetical protein